VTGPRTAVRGRPGVAGARPLTQTDPGKATSHDRADDFRQDIAEGLEKHAPVTKAIRDAVVRMLSFIPADVT
jgi:hypothetical protein